MNNNYSLPITDELDELDDYPEVTEADLERATFRVGRTPALRKQRITIALDTAVIEYFRAQAGGRGYQALINNALRQAVATQELETTLRRVIREELAQYNP